MKKFIAVIIAATIIGGFVGGELMDRTFSLTGAVIGGIGLASVLLGLGAFFDAQEKKKRKKELTPEVRAVFDRMFGNAPSGSTKNQTAQNSHSGGGTDHRSVYLTTTFNLLSIQLLPKYSNPKQAFGALMTNKRAAGYVFGFHDSLLQKLGLYDPNHKDSSTDLLKQSYKGIFGEQAGFALYTMSLGSQDDSIFIEGRMNGGNEIANYIDSKVPPLGLGRILILGMDA